MSSSRGFAFQSFGSGFTQIARAFGETRAPRGRLSMMLIVLSFPNGLGSNIAVPRMAPGSCRKINDVASRYRTEFFDPYHHGLIARQRLDADGRWDLADKVKASR
jgi:hypothetical protein